MPAKSSAALRYTAMRLGIFVACFLVMWGLVHFGLAPAGANDSNFFWVLLLALVVSAPLSLVLLRKQRDAMSEQLVEKVDQVKGKFQASRSQEDGV
ncbi:DUF4229 domain-containing protein [Streptomyces sp. NPDC018031]|uniref:DUF4229 domain-containing protein n=1 Tax=Streptomyces sp. NPDC018031 TaxID=3365033 RepID=UPI0037B26437